MAATGGLDWTTAGGGGATFVSGAATCSLAAVLVSVSGTTRDAPHFGHFAFLPAALSGALILLPHVEQATEMGMVPSTIRGVLLANLLLDCACAIYHGHAVWRERPAQGIGQLDLTFQFCPSGRAIHPTNDELSSRGG